MSVRILFYLDVEHKTPWIEALQKALPDADIRVWPNWGDAEEVSDIPTYAFVWEPPAGLIAQYKQIRAVFSIGAGVDHLTRDPSLPADLNIVRMSDDGLKEGMAEHVLMCTLALHRKFPQSMAQQRAKLWQRHISPAASDLTIGLMGYGALGQYVAQALKPLGYNLIAWARTHRQPDGIIDAAYAGTGQLDDFLKHCNIVVGLLPDTAETTNLLNAKSLAQLRKGAGVINAGRGNLIHMPALISALTSGHLAGAFLDVFAEEPLPQDDPAWQTDNLFITPHVAAITRPQTAADYVADGIARFAAGEAPATLLDRDRGY